MSKAVGTRETQTHTDLDSGAALWVKNNVHRIKDLPRPGVKWKSDVPGFSGSLVRKLLIEDLIERVPGGVPGEKRFYRTKPEAYEAVQVFKEKSEESDRLLPCDDESCPGKGFVTTSEGLECKYCGEVHDKEVIR